MSDVSNCPHCGHQVQIPQELLGRLVRCPLCGQTFTAGGDQLPDTVSPVHGVEPHRGGLILTLGILSLVICGLLGPFAWYMGSEDLQKMRRGRMDKSGYGITQAGYILGIISTILTAVGCLLGMFWFLIIIVAAGAGGH